MLKNKELNIFFGVVIVALLAGVSFYFGQRDATETTFADDYDISRITQDSILAYRTPDTYTEEQRENFQRLFKPWQETLTRIGIDSLEEGGQPLLQVGVLKFSVGDYKGAEEAWQYLYHLDSDGYLVNGNLGNLYYYYLKEYEKAEFYYLRALALTPIAPANHYTYITELFDLYRYELKDEKKAEALLEHAYGELDESMQSRIRIFAADYFLGKGDKNKAKLLYEEVLILNPEHTFAKDALEKL